MPQTYNRTSYAKSYNERCSESGLSFRPMSVDDISAVRPCLENNRYRTCDYTLGGMFMWIGYFNYEYCIYDDTLFVKGVSENHPDMVAFSLPLGKLPLSESVGLIKDYCLRNGLKLAFSAIPVDCAEELAALCNGTVENLEQWSDYLYSAEALATLTGKQYSKKRNHVNRFFLDNPGRFLEMITADNMTEVKEFMSNLDLSAKTDPQVAKYELQQCLDVLDHIDDYLFDGAVLRDAGGHICAATLGEVVGDTLYVHIEKMNHLVAGAGETINKLFAAEMLLRHSGLRYINREEDMGDPGLKFAKESYHPVAVLEKCNVVAR